MDFPKPKPPTAPAPINTITLYERVYDMCMSGDDLRFVSAFIGMLETGARISGYKNICFRNFESFVDGEGEFKFSVRWEEPKTQKTHHALITELFWFYLKRMEAYLIGRDTELEYGYKTF